MLGRPLRKGFLQAAFLVAVLEAGRLGSGGCRSHHRPLSWCSTRLLQSWTRLHKHAHLGCWLERAAELPHSWLAAPDLLHKGSFGRVGAPRDLGLWRVQPLLSP